MTRITSEEQDATAGPWHRDGFNLSTILRCVREKGHPDAKHTSGDYDVIARCEGSDWVAVSLLVVEAPALRDALRETLHMLEDAHRQLGMYTDSNSLIVKARAALSRATGSRP